MYFKYFFLLGGGRGQHPLGPENPLKSIDFTGAGGDGLTPIAPGPLRIRIWTTVVYNGHSTFLEQWSLEITSERECSRK